MEVVKTYDPTTFSTKVSVRVPVADYLVDVFTVIPDSYSYEHPVLIYDSYRMFNEVDGVLPTALYQAGVAYEPQGRKRGKRAVQEVFALEMSVDTVLTLDPI